jgi:hypothetical protein
MTVPQLGIKMPFMFFYSDALFTKTQHRVLAVLFGQSYAAVSISRNRRTERV